MHFLKRFRVDGRRNDPHGTPEASFLASLQGLTSMQFDLLEVHPSRLSRTNQRRRQWPS